MPKIYVRRRHGEHRHGSGLVVTTRWQGIDADKFPDTLVTSDPAIEVETEAEHRRARRKGADVEEPTPTEEPTEEPEEASGEEPVATMPTAREEGES